MFTVLEAERPAGSLYCSYITHCAVTVQRWQTATCSLRGFSIRVCQAGLCRVCCFYFLLLHLASVHHVSRWLLLVNPKEEVAQTTSCFLRVLDFVLIHYWCPGRSTLQFPTQTGWKTPSRHHFVTEPVCSLLYLKEPVWTDAQSFSEYILYFKKKKKNTDKIALFPTLCFFFCKEILWNLM